MDQKEQRSKQQELREDNEPEVQFAFADLEAINAGEIKGGEKLPPPTTPISAPPPRR